MRKHLSEAFGITLPTSDQNGGQEGGVKVFDIHVEATESDLILCMDKFVAEDVMKEASLYELTRRKKCSFFLY